MADRDVESRVRVTKEGDPEAIRELGRDVDRLGDAAQEATGDLDRAGRELGQTEKAARGASVDVDRLEREVEQLRGALRTATTSLDRFKTSGRGIGKVTAAFGGLRTVVAGLGLIGVAETLRRTIEASERQAKALQQLDQAIESTGGKAGITAGELVKIAQGLQQVTNFGDEAIEEMQAVLLTFTNLGRDVLPETTERVLDIATRMDTDLKSAALQVGKALNDPIAGLDGLSRAGIQFSDAQKETIRTMAETGRLAEAQGLILAELETQFGGSARAARTASSGMEALGNAAGDVLEKMGEGGLLQAIRFVTADLTKLAEGSNTTAERLGRGVGVAVLSMKAALEALLPLLQLVGGAFAGMASKATASMAGLQLALGEVAERFGKIELAEKLRQDGEVLANTAEGIRKSFEGAFSVDTLKAGAEDVRGTLGEIKTLFQDTASSVDDSAGEAAGAVKQIPEAIEGAATRTGAAASKIEGDVRRFLSGIPGAITETTEEIEKQGEVLAEALERLGGTQGVRLLPPAGRDQLREDVEAFVDAARELGEKIDPEIAAVANSIGVLVPPWQQAATAASEAADEVRIAFDDQGKAIVTNVSALEQAAEAAGKVKISLDEQGQALISNIDAADKAAQAGEKVTISYDEQGKAIVSNLQAVEKGESKIQELASGTERLAEAAGRTQGPLQTAAEAIRGIANIEIPGVKLLVEQLEKLGVLDLSGLSGSLDAIESKLASVRAEAEEVVASLNAIDTAGSGGGAPAPASG